MKKIIIFSLVLLTMGCSSVPKSSQKQEKPLLIKDIKARFKEIISKSDPNINIGIMISSLKDGSVVFEKNADRHFVPASTMKIITLAAALYYLGPYYRFETDIYASGLNESGTKAKNLFIKGSGDPSLMDHDLANLAFELKQRGLSQIDGDIYVDDQIFDENLWANGISAEDRSRGFGAPICGLNLNYNRFLIKTLPSHSVEKIAYSIIKPETKYIKIKPSVITKNDKSGRKVNIKIIDKNGKREDWPGSMSTGLERGDTIEVSGYLPKNGAPHYTLLSVHDPAMFAGNFFKEKLKNLGVKVNGKVFRGLVPESAFKIASHQSRSLSEALIDFTKISNNVPLASLVKTIGVKNGEQKASTESGIKLINEFLAKEVGIESGSLVAAEGAGLSRYNLITPHQMVKVLNYAALHFNLGPEFMSALPIAGQDGTLSGRLKREGLKGQIRAKDGYMSGMSNLVGYISAQNGERYSFAFMINNIVGSTDKYKKMQEEFLASMISDAKPALATSGVK